MSAPAPAFPHKTFVGRPRALMAACAAHVVHDGYTELLYVLLPLWKQEFALGYAALGLVRAAYPGTMALAQVPVDALTAHFGVRPALVGGTLVSAAGFALAGVSQSLPMLFAALVVGGLGSSTQHPRGSASVTQAYGDRSRDALGIYNFAGDLGKVIFPAATSLLLVVGTWRSASFALAALGVAAASGLQALVPASAAEPRADATRVRRPGKGRGFALLFAIGMLDIAPRVGFLLFLPFVLSARHASEATVGFGLALLFCGGAFGKLACGWLGGRLGLVGTVVATEAMTALLIAAVPFLPLGGILALLPVLGLALNGTSSVLYGTVPEVSGGDPGRAFALFYTGIMGSAALAPVALGSLADSFGREAALVAAAATALATIPLVLLLRRRLVVG